jgi:hypothetical protein
MNDTAKINHKELEISMADPILYDRDGPSTSSPRQTGSVRHRKVVRSRSTREVQV